MMRQTRTQCQSWPRAASRASNADNLWSPFVDGVWPDGLRLCFSVWVGSFPLMARRIGDIVLHIWCVPNWFYHRVRPYLQISFKQPRLKGLRNFSLRPLRNMSQRKWDCHDHRSSNEVANSMDYDEHISLQKDDFLASHGKIGMSMDWTW
jgi:hypothetical protein